MLTSAVFSEVHFRKPLQTRTNVQANTVQVAGDADTLPSGRLRPGLDQLQERGRGMTAKTEADAFVRAASLEDLQASRRLAVRVGGHSLALFLEGEKVHAVDNRCPHMGFPLDRGTVNDGLLTCHWHQRVVGELIERPAGFEVEALVFPTQIRNGDV